MQKYRKNWIHFYKDLSYSYQICWYLNRLLVGWMDPFWSSQCRFLHHKLQSGRLLCQCSEHPLIFNGKKESFTKLNTLYKTAHILLHKGSMLISGFFAAVVSDPDWLLNLEEASYHFWSSFTHGKKFLEYTFIDFFYCNKHYSREWFNWVFKQLFLCPLQMR